VFVQHESNKVTVRQTSDKFGKHMGMPQIVKPKLHHFDLLWICCTINTQQMGSATKSCVRNGNL